MISLRMFLSADCCLQMEDKKKLTKQRTKQTHGERWMLQAYFLLLYRSSLHLKITCYFSAEDQSTFKDTAEK